MSAQDRGWGVPGPASIRTLVRTDGLRLPLNSRILDLAAMLIDLTELGHGYDVRVGETWGYAYRYISGTTIWSNHAWGLAIDINAPSNPYASAEWHRRNARGTRPFGLKIVCNMPQPMIEMWEAHGFRWGGRYDTKPDPMHFEFMGTPGDAAVITMNLRAYLESLGRPAPLPPQEEIVDYDRLRQIVREEVNGALAHRGVTADADDGDPVGAIRELRQNVRKVISKLDEGEG